MVPILPITSCQALMSLVWLLMEEAENGFGTKANGVYLISADNMTQVKHILSSNSPLLSDNILSIAINNATGEVFFGNGQGVYALI